MLFMTMPTIAETIAPDTPPPTNWPTSAPISMPPVAPCSIGMSDVRSDPPAAPPRAPAIVLPVVPRVTFFAAAPTALPPIAPAMSWMMRLIIVPDISFSSAQAAKSHGRCGDKLPYGQSSASFLLSFGHKSTESDRVEHGCAISHRDVFGHELPPK